MEVVELLKEIESKKNYFKTDNYPMSIGELSNLYSNKEIIIRPEFQRLFRWSHGQKVKLIESILLGIPIPPIFVYQDESGIWEIVDGLQRVSTVLQFMGILENEDRLQLSATKYLPSLNNIYWDAENPNEFELPNSLKLFFKRAKLNMTIILSESSKTAKYEVFQRLNTGGSNASNQEVRNSLMIMINHQSFQWFNTLTNYQPFLDSISITERLLDEQYHMELALRFIGLYNIAYDNKKDLGDYLDDVNEILLTYDAPRLEAIENTFKNTFNLLFTLLGDKAFKKFDGVNFKGKFLESSFEAISVGVASNIASYTATDDEFVIGKIKNIYNEHIFQENTGSGSNARTRIPRIVPFAKTYFMK